MARQLQKYRHASDVWCLYCLYPEQIRAHIPNPGISVVAMGSNGYGGRDESGGRVLAVEDDSVNGAIVVV